MSTLLLQHDTDHSDTTEHNYVYPFGDGFAEFGSEARDLLGNKGANLCELARIGAPVPPGFVISTDACRYRILHGEAPAELSAQIRAGVASIEKSTGLRFGSSESPLLVSVRSGARDSMPGMMDTVLNVGASTRVLDALAGETATGHRFALDCRRRFLQMFGSVVLGVDANQFDIALASARERSQSSCDAELPATELEQLITQFEGIVGDRVPEDPWEQLECAVFAVFDSWMGERAQVYRDHHGIPDDWGTAVTVQAMVFGNNGPSSASGVAFTRDPATGDKAAFGEYLPNAQGEDVVSGSRTPQPVPAADSAHDAPFGDAFYKLHAWLDTLELHYRDMQDVEFTIDDGRLWILQTRSGKRSPQAAIQIAIDLADSGVIDRAEAIMRVSVDSLTQLQSDTLSETIVEKPLLVGMPASPGVATGKVTFDVDRAVEWHDDNVPVILVRDQTAAADVRGMIASQAVITAHGGMTSHAAVVARGMALPCISGCTEIVIDNNSNSASIGATTLQEGDWITVDATHGIAYAGKLKTTPAHPPESLTTLLEWADDHRRLRVFANADTPEDATRSVQAGAEGIGLCRTEHMFFGMERLTPLVGMLLSETDAERAPYLDTLRNLQRRDFAGIFNAMHGMPITIRLIDPPLHEFLPDTEGADFVDLAHTLGRTTDELRLAAEHLREQNPMIGNRGIRLAAHHPDILRMQCVAIAEALIDAEFDPCQLSIMIPLVMNTAELRAATHLVRHELASVLDTQAAHAIRIGTMIELPRACVTAQSLAAHADFFSFGTNDLTQMTLGLSRDDTAELIKTYLGQGILAADPFSTIDQEGVGALLKIACDSARDIAPNLEIGVCGEHAGDDESINFFEQLNLTYISCSPPRIQAARLAAAQAAIRRKATPRTG